MKLYEVIPIAKVLGKETLSYFGQDSIELGALVSVPLRKKTSFAIVIGKKDISTEKASIKSSDFILKKIIGVKSPHFLSQAFLEATRDTAHYFGTNTGSILRTILPELILTQTIKNKAPIVHKKSEARRENLVLQSEDEERIANYKAFIRGEFAKKSSVYFCLPTIEDIRYTKDQLEKGIEQYTAVLHSSLSKKEFQAELKKIENVSHPILIVGTVPFLSIERDDLRSIILDRENSRSYKTQARPYFDLRIFVEKLAEHTNKKLIIGDMLLSTETMWKCKNDEYAEFSPIKSRILSPAQSLLVDMKLKKGVYEEEFRVLSRELEALIDKSKEDNERLLIFSSRKGLSPTTVCGDCGLVVTCNNCKAPVVLYTRGGNNFFKCNKCGEERDAMERCRNCDSWKLETLGIGIERVEQEIRKLFPDLKLFRLDKESVKSEKRALEIVNKFQESPGSVLLGTELSLFYLKKPIENVAIASIDSLFALPDFRINEKIFYTLLTLRSRAEKVFIIQTRNADETVFDYALKGSLADFYREEIDDRKKFLYPPYSVFIKLSIEGKKPAILEDAQTLAKLLDEYNPNIYPSFSPSRRGNTIMNVILKLQSESWPDDKLMKKIMSLPPQVAVRVDPESLI